MESNRWIATVASLWIQWTCGASYAFGIYSSVLKSSQGYDQSTLDTVSVFKDIGANAGTLSGLLYSAVVTRRIQNRCQVNNFASGPWLVHLAGAVQCFAGYFLMWLSVVGVIHRPPVPLMWLFMFLAAHAQTFFNTANVVTSVVNFQEYSGTIVGIMKGCLGLSGAILVQLYEVLCKGNPSAFLLVVALLPTIMSVLLMCFVRIYEKQSGDDKKYLNWFSVVSVALGVYLMILIIIENVLTLTLWARIITFVFMLLMLSSPLKIATTAQRIEAHNQASLSEGRNPLLAHSQLEVPQKLGDPSDCHKVPGQPTFDDKMLHNVEDLNLLQAMSTLDFWLLFVAMACGLGSGLATINNISQIGESLGYLRVEISTLVSLWSIWNFTGRFGAGYVSDYLLHTHAWPRPLLMIMTLATMTAGHIIIASGFSSNLYVGSILVGICYGSQWCLMPTIASEIFGVGHFGTIFNTIAIASPLGSYLLSVRVIGYFYDEEASGKGNTCLGSHCFMLSFFIMASVMLFASFVASVLYYRSRGFYKMLLAKRLKNASREVDNERLIAEK